MSAVDDLKEFVFRQLDAEENERVENWLSSHDEAFGWIEKLDDENIEVSEPVFLFLEETLQRRNADFGSVRRAQFREALRANRAFPKM